ncbi:thiamine ABC transporter substrate-binding protein [Poseidonocella sedimentorum]|uniref:Thiamine transport system substrate-binding protein n=1 Tax=Poseidonocella sedimentorum TaxID=871652 RepID=A0A1I6DYD2_9RHOB|nr:thiamine ABC transporter substrate binding subunit [Poseidonocella sedimentorum]SFR10342.1 thiamine transport system substrate-binding protein [Poseidonocella sedimentorum]
MRAYIFAASLLTTAGAAAVAQSDPLTVYAPDYFTSEWGPGPAIEAAFEAECGCEMEFLPADLPSMLLLEGARTRADVVIGLNTDVTKRTRESGLLAPHGQDLSALTLPIDWTDEVFLPFDWSYVSFVYNAEAVANPPRSFAELLDAPEDLRIVIQDPRSSISGLALLLWVKTLYGDEAETVWERLAPRILTVTKGWSEAYGLFTDGEVPMVLSFNTSPAYHIVAEEDETKVSAIFEEGHYAYVELAAKVAGTDQPELADAFMEFILSPTFQAIIPETNWSYPAALPREDWPQVFQELPEPPSAIFLTEDEADAIRTEALDEWQRALSR